jgi:hypothetical protein
MLSNVYGWTACAVVALFVVSLFGTGIVNFLLSWFGSVYSSAGQIQHIDFSSNDDINLYIPQVRRQGLPFPLLICDIDHIDNKLVGWTDPVHSHDFWNLIYDVPWEGVSRRRIEENPVGIAASLTSATRPDVHQTSSTGDLRIPSNPIFSMVKHYPPAWNAKLHEQGF